MSDPAGTAGQAVQPISASVPTKISMDADSLQKLRDNAMNRAKDIQDRVAKAAAANYTHAKLVAEDLARSRTAGEAGAKLLVAVKRADTGPMAQAVARLLISLYFLNLVYDDVEQWRVFSAPELQARLMAQGYAPVWFPYVKVLVLLPAALLVALGVRVTVTGSVLLVYELLDSAGLVWMQTLMLLVYGQKPNELMVKRLAMLGCAAMVLAHSMRDNKQLNSYAGLLLATEPRQPSARKSAVLLLGRLLMATLFIYVGITQIQRVIARDRALWQHSRHVDPLQLHDGHDNNWLLLEFALALPFAAGFKTEIVSRALAGTLACEALTCWPFWASYWPTWTYRAHVRSHFITNLSVSGGLLLLQSFGAGTYTVDQLLRKKAN